MSPVVLQLWNYREKRAVLCRMLAFILASCFLINLGISSFHRVPP